MRRVTWPARARASRAASGCERCSSGASSRLRRPSPTGFALWPLRDVAVALMAGPIIRSAARGRRAGDDLEGVAGDRVALVDVLDRLGPAAVRRARDVHRRALVGEHQPVALE